jgi:poly-gamma-glutamate capsule biosynthesis protein CapA/YwtB (metallophosphatase superfamily)
MLRIGATATLAGFIFIVVPALCSSAQSGAEPAPAPPTKQPSINIIAVGDVMLGSSFPDESGLPPNDGVDLLQEVTPILQKGDIVFGNLEGPLVDGGTTKKCGGLLANAGAARTNTRSAKHRKKTKKSIAKPLNCYAFSVPTRYGQYLKNAGFTVMSLANNHALDFGQEGRASSRHVLDSLGIAHSGEVGDIAHLTVGGTKVALIAFATYPASYNFLDLEDAIDTVREAKADADIVIVSFHGGAEGTAHQHVAPGDERFVGEDRGDLRRFAHAMIDNGAQLVIGSGPHVVRAMEVYCGHLIAYSLGNFATYGSFNLSAENGISLILEVRLAPDGAFLGGQVYPVKQEKPGGPHLDPDLAILPVLRSLSAADFPSTHIDVSPLGELSAPSPASRTCEYPWDYVGYLFPRVPCGIFSYRPCVEFPGCRF